MSAGPEQRVEKRTCLHDQFHRAPPAAGLFDEDLMVDAVFEGGDMGDDAHEPVAFGQAGEDPDGLFQTFLVEGTEALAGTSSPNRWRS